MFNFAPLLIGAGVGALGGLLTGRDPLKGALVGGATGGLLGSIPALGAAGAGTGGAKVAIGDIAKSGALPASLQGSTLAPVVDSSIQNIGSNVIGDAGIKLAPFAANAPMSYSLAPEVLSGAGINNLASYSTGAGTDIMAKTPSMFDQISPYLNVRDLSGAAQVASQYQPRQQQMQAPSGRVSEGRAPQGTDVMALLQSIKQPERRRITLL